MATNKLILQNSSGNIGIGTTSPNISQGVSGSIALTISGTTSGRNALIELNGTRTTDGQISSYIRFFNNAAATPFADIQGIRGSSNTVGSLALFTSGTERLKIGSSGYVGIGITNPETYFHVSGSHVSGRGTIEIDGSNFGIIAVRTPATGDTTNGYWGIRASDTAGNDLMYFGHRYTTTYEGFVVDPSFAGSGALFVKKSNGFVGINTTNPTTPVYIRHNNLDEPYAGLYIKNVDTTGAAYTGIVADGVLQSHYRFALNGALKYQWRCGAGSGTDDLRLYSWTLTDDVMTMTATGRVGIGRTDPGRRLHVLGSGSTSAILIQNGFFEVDGTNADAATSGGTNNLRIGYPASGRVGFNLQGTEVLTLTVGGGVGIGTTNPSTKLHVNGGALIQGDLSLNNNNLTDFQILGYSSHVIRPTSDGYGGFTLKTFDGSSAGYFLIRDTSDVDVYKQYGVTLVTDRGPITLAARGGTIGDNSDRNFINFMTAGGVGSAQVRMTINKSGQITMPYQPRFYAYGNVGSTHTTGSTVRFGYTLTNIGSHYSSTNGRFTAPVAGDYYFFWGHIGATSDTVYRFDVYRSGTYLGELRLDATETGSAYVSNASRGIVIPMAVNDYVYIYYTSDSGSGFYPGADTSSLDFIHFGGWLLG